MKIIKLLAALGVAIWYCVSCYIDRGYWNPVSDAFMIAFMASVCAIGVGTFKERNREREKEREKVKSFEERYDELRNSINKKSA